MVSLWGVIDVECAKHTTLHQFDRDPHATLRHYQPAVAVETDVGEQLDDGANNDGFRRLAFYIGVFGEPTNRAVSYVQMPPPDDDDQTGSTVDRTTPGEEKPEEVAMTAPVVNQNGKMAFILPAKYQLVSEAPPSLHLSLPLIPRHTPS